MDSTKLKFIALIGVLFLATVSADSFLKEQPSYIPPCKIYEPGFTECSTNTVQKLFGQLPQGIPGLKLSSVDPFLIKKVQYKQDNNQVATISANLTDLVVKGFANTIVKESKISKKDFSWETKLLIPKMRMDGKYNMVGKVLVVPLNGNGKMFIEIDKMNINMFTSVRLYEKGGFTFCNVTSVRIHLDISSLKSNFENLFSGNKEIEKSTIEFFNNNWQDVFEALRPVITQTVEDILLNIMQTVFHYIPANFFCADWHPISELYYLNKIVVSFNTNSGHNVLIENMNIKMFSSVKLYEKGGFTFYNVTGLRIELAISNLETNFENLFSGNKEIERSTIEFFNKNWRDVFEALRPVISQTVEEILLSLMQKVFHYIPANFFVSDIPTSEQLYGKM